MSANAAAPPSAWKAGLGSHSWLDYTAQTQHSCHQPQGRRSFRVVFSKIARRLPCFRPEKVIWSTASFWVTIIRGIVSQTVRQSHHEFSLPSPGTAAVKAISSPSVPRFGYSGSERAVFSAYRRRNDAATLRPVTELLGLGHQGKWKVNARIQIRVRRPAEVASPLGVVLMGYIESRAGQEFARITGDQFASFCHRSQRTVSMQLQRLEDHGFVERQRPGVHSHRLGYRLGRKYLAGMFVKAQGVAL
jgi:hypothetical protein